MAACRAIRRSVGLAIGCQGMTVLSRLVTRGPVGVAVRAQEPLPV